MEFMIPDKSKHMRVCAYLGLYFGERRKVGAHTINLLRFFFLRF